MWIFVKKLDFLKKISGKIEHLDPDPYSEYRSGSRVSSPNEYGSNTDPDPDPKPCQKQHTNSVLLSLEIMALFYRRIRKNLEGQIQIQNTSL